MMASLDFQSLLIPTNKWVEILWISLKFMHYIGFLGKLLVIESLTSLNIFR
jgi:hypothetical protein